MKGGSRTVDAYMQMQYTHISREGELFKLLCISEKKRKGKKREVIIITKEKLIQKDNQIETPLPHKHTSHTINQRLLIFMN